jgi:hypothetical protein
MKLKQFHPLSQGMDFAYLANEGAGNILYDALRNNNGTLHGGKWSIHDGTPGLELDAVSTEYVSIPQKIDTSGAITVAFGSYVATPASWATLFGGSGTDPSLDRLLAHAPHTDNILYWIYGNTAIGSDGRLTVDYTSYLSKLTNVALTSEGKGGAFKGIYFNGELAASAAVSDGPDGDVFIDIGRLRSAADLYHTGIITYLYIYNRRLSADEIRWLDYDVNGMFEPDFTPARIEYAAAGGLSIPVAMNYYNHMRA